jgi:hypothetical protein
MNKRELTHIIIAFIVLLIVIIITPLRNTDYPLALQAPLIAAIVLLANILAKKAFAFYLETDVEHELLSFSRYGFKAHWHFKKPVPIGVILPLFFSIITLGVFKCLTLLTYEARALKIKAARRHGFYSYTELTDWHNALIGASGIIALLFLGAVAYLLNIEYLAKISIYYSFFNMLPLSKLDGNQIFFGSRTLYAILGVIVLLFTAFAFLL